MTAIPTRTKLDQILTRRGLKFGSFKDTFMIGENRLISWRNLGFSAFLNLGFWLIMFVVADAFRLPDAGLYMVGIGILDTLFSTLVYGVIVFSANLGESPFFTLSAKRVRKFVTRFNKFLLPFFGILLPIPQILLYGLFILKLSEVLPPVTSSWHNLFSLENYELLFFGLLIITLSAVLLSAAIIFIGVKKRLNSRRSLEGEIGKIRAELAYLETAMKEAEYSPADTELAQEEQDALRASYTFYEARSKKLQAELSAAQNLTLSFKTRLNRLLFRIIGIITSVLLPPLLLLGVGLLFRIHAPAISLGILFYALGILFSFPLTVLFIAVVNLFFTVSSLVRVRANILIVSLLASVIPFLNDDSWQLIATMPDQNLLLLGLGIYIFPLLITAFSQWEVIWNSLYRKGWRPNQSISVASLMHICVPFQIEIDGHTKQISQHASELGTKLVPAKLDAVWIFIRTALKVVFFLILVPALVSVFAWYIFQFAIQDNLLADNWLQGITLHGTTSDLKVKAALLLATISASSSIVTLVANKKDLQEFLRQTFVRDIRFDKRLRLFYRFLLDANKIEMNYAHHLMEIEIIKKRGEN